MCLNKEQRVKFNAIPYVVAVIKYVALNSISKNRDMFAMNVQVKVHYIHTLHNIALNYIKMFQIIDVFQVLSIVKKILFKEIMYVLAKLHLLQLQEEYAAFPKQLKSQNIAWNFRNLDTAA